MMNGITVYLVDQAFSDGRSERRHGWMILSLGLPCLVQRLCVQRIKAVVLVLVWDKWYKLPFIVWAWGGGTNVWAVCMRGGEGWN